MNNIIKFSGLIMLSSLAFAGLYFLKTTLMQIIPGKANVISIIRAIPYLAINEKFWLAIFCYGTALGIFLFMVHDEEVSKLFSMAVGMNVLLTVIGATILLGDTLTATRIIGIFFIIFGIWIINGT